MTNNSSPSLPDDLPEQLRPLVELVDHWQRAFDDLWPEVLRLRRIFFVDGGEAARTAMEDAIREAAIARDKLEEAVAAMVASSGMDPDDFEGPVPPPTGDPFPAITRETVMGGAPAASAFVEDHLPDALELIELHAPNSALTKSV